MTRQRPVLWILAVVAVVGAAALANLLSGWRGPRAASIPTARVTRGSLRLDVHLNGEMRAGRSLTLTPPPAGTPLRLVRILETGTAVRAGDIVMEFDPVEQQHALAQSQSELLEAGQEIVKMQADAEVQRAQAEVDLLAARFDVRRADMDAAADATLIGAIEARKRALAVDEARRRLVELEERVSSRAATDRAALAALEARRDKARVAADRARQIIEQLAVPSPMNGLVVVKENRDTTNIFYSGMVLPEYRTGDTVLPGRIVVEVVDAQQTEIRARVSEQDRSNIAPGQTATVYPNALGGQAFSAAVATVSGLASRNNFFDGSGPARMFDAVLRIDPPDTRLRPGTTARVVVAGRELTDVLQVPRQAVLERDGQLVVHVQVNGVFEPREITVVGGTESIVAVEGLSEGDEVALVDPREAERPAAGGAAAGVSP